MVIEVEVEEGDSQKRHADEDERYSDARPIRPHDVLLQRCEVGEDLYLDLSGLNFIDSSGVRVFITAFLKLKPRGARLVLSSPNATIRRLFDLLGLTANGIVLQEASSQTGSG